MNNDREPVVNATREWLRKFVGRPQPQLGRRGSLCPFVPQALAKGTIEYRHRPELADVSAPELANALIEEVDDFVACTPFGDILHTRLVLLPGGTSEAWARLDRIYYRELKDAAVQRCAMVGQFHPHCDEVSVRMPSLLTSRAPEAMLAIRRMAVHDVLFLQDEPRWIAEYARWYGPEYQGNGTHEPLIADLRRKLLDRPAPHQPPRCSAHSEEE